MTNHSHCYQHYQYQYQHYQYQDGNEPKQDHTQVQVQRHKRCRRQRSSKFSCPVSCIRTKGLCLSLWAWAIVSSNNGLFKFGCIPVVEASIFFPLCSSGIFGSRREASIVTTGTVTGTTSSPKPNENELREDPRASNKDLHHDQQHHQIIPPPPFVHQRHGLPVPVPAPVDRIDANSNPNDVLTQPTNEISGPFSPAIPAGTFIDADQDSPSRNGFPQPPISFSLPVSLPDNANTGFFGMLAPPPLHPPPPPPFPQTVPWNEAVENTQNILDNNSNNNNFYPPPAYPSEQAQQSDQFIAPPFVPLEDMDLKEPPHHHSHLPPLLMQNHETQQQLFFLHRDLDEAFAREQHLLAELHNLTATSTALQQRERLHMHQLDVLTERVMQVETSAATDRLEALEYQANCTELSMQLELQKDISTEWIAKCEALMEQRQADEAIINDLRDNIKTAVREAEELAAMIEQNRMQEEGVSVKKTKRKRGFFAWLFGFGGSRSDSDGDEDGDSGIHLSNKDITKMRDVARSTLLTALRTERNSVSDLESALTTLQHNNSAIAEQVHSRDQIIEELNNRIAVFEEDKVVLKAALRQLQLEMSEEAPKMNKLFDDLAESEQEVKRIEEEIEMLVQNHAKEVESLQLIVDQKQTDFDSVESNLTVIGTYVDKLEERLADFTVARREIEGRELALRKADEKAKEAETQREAMQIRVNDLMKEHDELKALLSELAQERAELQKANSKFGAERSALQNDVQRLRQSYAKLDNEAKSLRGKEGDDQSILKTTQKQLDDLLAANEQISTRLQDSDAKVLELQQLTENLKAGQMEQVNLLEVATTANRSLQGRIAQLECERESAEQSQQALMRESAIQLESLQKELEITREAEIKASEEACRMLEATETVEEIAEQQLQQDTSIEAQNVEVLAAESVDDGSTSPASDTSSNPLGVAKDSAISVNGSKTTNGTVTSPRDDVVEPSLENRTFSTSAANASAVSLTVSTNQTKAQRTVPLRQLRKFFSKSTGIHGLFTKSSSTHRIFVERRSNVTRKPEVEQASNIATRKPNVMKHTLWGMQSQTPNTKAGK